MKRRTTRHDQASLNALAIARAHRFQRVRLEQMLAMKWDVQLVKSFDGVTVICVKRDTAFGMIAPNGLFQRPLHGQRSVKWEWSKMKDYAQATIPTPGLIVNEVASS